MIGIILAAGRGKRLKPLTDGLPKTLIKLNGKTILERAIENMNECGIQEIIVVAGYLSDLVEDAVNDYQGVELVINKDYNTTDNMYSLLLSREYCKDKPIFIMNGDLLVSKAVIRKSLICNSSNMPIDTNPELKDGQKVQIANESITAIGKKLPIGDGTAINIIVLTREDANTYFDKIESIIRHEGRPDEWWEAALNEVLDKVSIQPVIIDNDFWLEIDDKDDLERASEILSDLKD